MIQPDDPTGVWAFRLLVLVLIVMAALLWPR